MCSSDLPAKAATTTIPIAIHTGRRVRITPAEGEVGGTAGIGLNRFDFLFDDIEGTAPIAGVSSAPRESRKRTGKVRDGNTFARFDGSITSSNMQSIKLYAQEVCS